MKTNTYTLSNDLRVMLIDTQAFPSATCLLLVGAGSRYENKKNNGVAHFFEHMAFKGSKKYPNAYVLASVIEGLGGEFNAFTSKDYTGYYVKAPVEHVETVLDVLSDMIMHPKLAEEEIEKEKGVIVQEINMYQDTPQRIVFDLYENLLYKNHPLGYDTTGTEKTVRSFTRSTFTEYMESLYHPSNAVLVVAGGLSQEKPEHHVEKKFGAWRDAHAKAFESIEDLQTQSEMLLKYKKSEQAHLCFGFRTFKRTDEDKYALAVLSAVLGMGMSSRLFTEVREKRGLCYAISTYHEHYDEVGNMLTYAGVSTAQDKVAEAIKIIRAQHELLCEKPVSDTELTRAKALIKGKLILSLEDTFNVAYIYGEEFLHTKKYTSVDEIMKKIEKVTVDDVLQVAQRVIHPNKANLAMIGPFKDEEPFLKLILPDNN